MLCVVLRHQIRDIDSFWEPGIDPAAQRMRHEAYSMRRHEKMKAVRTAWRVVANEGPAEEGDGHASAPRPGAVQGSDETGTLLELERRRLEKLQIKQQREIQQMMEYEMQMAKVREETEKKLKKEAEREEQRKRERLKRKKQAAERKRLQDMQKKLEEELEEKAKRELAQREYEREKALAEKKRKEERRIQLEVRFCGLYAHAHADRHR